MTDSTNLTASTDKSMVDLQTYRPGDWLRLADGALIKPTAMRAGRGRDVSDRYYVCDGDIGYSLNGIYNDYRDSKANIVEIIPAERMTLLEWISDRNPTAEDGGSHGVVHCLTDDGRIVCVHCYAVGVGKRWAHCPGWTPPTPKPEVKVPPAELVQEWGNEWHCSRSGTDGYRGWTDFLVRRTAEWCQQEVQP